MFQMIYISIVFPVIVSNSLLLLVPHNMYEDLILRDASDSIMANSHKEHTRLASSGRGRRNLSSMAFLASSLLYR